jgi:hypothetical protein
MGTTQQCPRIGCLYMWDYNGNADHVTSCPKCHTSVMIRKGVESL